MPLYRSCLGCCCGPLLPTCCRSRGCAAAAGVGLLLLCKLTAMAPSLPHRQGTVGAGLPIISTLKSLLDTGDEVQRIEGVFRWGRWRALL